MLVVHHVKLNVWSYQARSFSLINIDIKHNILILSFERNLYFIKCS